MTYDIFDNCLIYSYTRAQAIEDGLQVEVTSIAQEAGIRFPVFLTRNAWDSYVAVPPNVTCQDESGRLWDILWMLRCAIQRCHRRYQTTPRRIDVSLYVRNDNRKAKPVKLTAVCGPLDINNPQPAITIMLPNED